LSIPAAELGFNRKHATRTDEDVIYVEILTNNIVNGLGAIHAKLIQRIRDVKLAKLPAIDRCAIGTNRRNEIAATPIAMSAINSHKRGYAPV
jgi:hypothetical protein